MLIWIARGNGDYFRGVATVVAPFVGTWGSAQFNNHAYDAGAGGSESDGVGDAPHLIFRGSFEAGEYAVWYGESLGGTEGDNDGMSVISVHYQLPPPPSSPPPSLSPSPPPWLLPPGLPPPPPYPEGAVTVTIVSFTIQITGPVSRFGPSEQHTYMTNLANATGLSLDSIVLTVASTSSPATAQSSATAPSSTSAATRLLTQMAIASDSHTSSANQRSLGARRALLGALRPDQLTIAAQTAVVRVPADRRALQQDPVQGHQDCDSAEALECARRCTSCLHEGHEKDCDGEPCSDTATSVGFCDSRCDSEDTHRRCVVLAQFEGASCPGANVSAPALPPPARPPLPPGELSRFPSAATIVPTLSSWSNAEWRAVLGGAIAIEYVSPISTHVLLETEWQVRLEGAIASGLGGAAASGKDTRKQAIIAATIGGVVALLLVALSVRLCQRPRRSEGASKEDGPHLVCKPKCTHTHHLSSASSAIDPPDVTGGAKGGFDSL